MLKTVAAKILNKYLIAFVVLAYIKIGTAVIVENKNLVSSRKWLFCCFIYFPFLVLTLTSLIGAFVFIYSTVSSVYATYVVCLVVVYFPMICFLSFSLNGYVLFLSY